MEEGRKTLPGRSVLLRTLLVSVAGKYDLHGRACQARGRDACFAGLSGIGLVPDHSHYRRSAMRNAKPMMTSVMI